MKIGAVIICRYNSSRLPGKILKKINGKSILTYIIERLKCVQNLDDFIVATSINATDQPIVDYCIKNQIKYFRGDLKNVAERFLHAGLKFDYDYAIRVNGDNLFLDHKLISEMISILDLNHYDLVSNVKDRTFPKGISVEIVNMKFYKKLFDKFNQSKYQEHVTNYMYEHPNCGNFYHFINHTSPKAAGAQLAIDTENDFMLAGQILNSFKKDHTEYGFADVFKRMIDIKGLH